MNNTIFYVVCDHLNYGYYEDSEIQFASTDLYAVERYIKYHSAKYNPVTKTGISYSAAYEEEYDSRIERYDGVQDVVPLGTVAHLYDPNQFIDDPFKTEAYYDGHAMYNPATKKWFELLPQHSVQINFWKAAETIAAGKEYSVDMYDSESGATYLDMFRMGK